MDKSPSGSIEVSKLKASTSAVLTLAGGLPIITKSGEHLGGVGVGVSGARSDQDELIAKTAIEAISKQLNEN